jgi:multifunctional 2-oxoglutarate metabolism enzyme
MSDLVESETSFGANAWLVDDMYEQYRQDPESVSESWRKFFTNYRPGGANLARPATPEVRPDTPPPGMEGEEVPPPASTAAPVTVAPAATPPERPAVTVPEREQTTPLRRPVSSPT